MFVEKAPVWDEKNGTASREKALVIGTMAAFAGVLAVLLCNTPTLYNADAFVYRAVPSVKFPIANRADRRRRTKTSSRLQYSIDDSDADDDEDEYIDTRLLGDWRNFRRNLSMNPSSDGEPSSEKGKTERKVVSKENEELLRSQNEQLAEEYATGVWAHPTSTVSRFIVGTSAV